MLGRARELVGVVDRIAASEEYGPAWSTTGRSWSPSSATADDTPRYRIK
jgi:hypothetical protein